MTGNEMALMASIAVDMQDKAVDEVLGKIRAEIKGKYRVILKGTPKDDWAVRWNDCLDEVLQIIDKYKTESEDKDADSN